MEEVIWQDYKLRYSVNAAQVRIALQLVLSFYRHHQLVYQGQTRNSGADSTNIQGWINQASRLSGQEAQRMTEAELATGIHESKTPYHQ